jgi:hypothetical protein
VAPAGAQYGQVVVESSGIGANGTMYFDDITLRPVTRTANTAFGITWYAWTGRVYAVESRANLLSPWVGVPGLSNIVVPQNGNYTAWDTNTGGVATRFYHVSVRLP